MSNKITFWELLEENKIEIPVIQRDYAQGREEGKINAIREEFVTDLIATLSSKGEKTMHLGFIYGKIEGKDKHSERERNKRAIDNILNAVEGYAQQLDIRISTEIDSSSTGSHDSINLPVFIPLDGQQRLTTLFLLHWYLTVFSDDSHLTSRLSTLHHFSYKTRKSSMDFCDAICQVENVSSLKKTRKKLSESIQNNTWFRKIWTKDSTVKGMVVMLDEIHRQLKGTSNQEEMLNVLLDKNAALISFDFLDLHELNQTDELYVKMNARGKQLSGFEHLKAWLQNYVSTNGLNTSIEDKEWKLKIDRSWLDLFWTNKANNVFYIDNVLDHAFKQIALFHYIASNEKNKETLQFSQEVRDKSHIQFSKFSSHDFFSAGTLNFLFNTLNALCHKERIEQYEIWLGEITSDKFFDTKIELSRFYLRNDKRIERPESVFYYAFLLFLNYSKDKESEVAFKTWMRFTRNIIFNTYIQNPENFADAIKSLYGLKEKIDSIKSYITEAKIPFFGDSVKHEKNKAKLEQDVSHPWKEEFIKIENHRYFRGDIDFVLEMSKIEGEYDFERFCSYGNCVWELFDDAVRDHSKMILHRALLTVGDYLPEVGANLLFPLAKRDSLRARKDNWQRVFNDPDHRKILKKLCDYVINNPSDVQTALLEKCSSYNVKDWKWYFIKSYRTVNYCKQGFIRFEGENDVQLLETSRIYGKHAELRSYFAYIKLEINKMESFPPFNHVFYWSNRMSKYPFSCIRFTRWEYHGHIYKLELTYANDGFYQIQILTEDNAKLSQTIAPPLIDVKWEFNEDKTLFYQRFQDDSEIKPLLFSTLKKLSKIL